MCFICSLSYLMLYYFSAESKCNGVNIMLHEMMHAIGFEHEFSRPGKVYIDLKLKWWG